MISVSFPFSDRAITSGPAETTAEQTTTSEQAATEWDPAASLRVLPFAQWEVWRPRFYTWLQAWTARFENRTQKLLAQQERRNRTANAVVSTAAAQPEAKVVQAVKPEAKVMTPVEATESASAEVELPDNFTPGTVVEVIWSTSNEISSIGQTPLHCWAPQTM